VDHKIKVVLTRVQGSNKWLNETKKH
jgi:hypothetical protein